MNAMELADYLPHRYPFLLVDRVTELTPGKRILGCKMVSINEPFFQGHFPDSPIMPGVLIVEAMAQVSGVLAAATAPEGAAQTIHYLAGIDGARFKRPVVPGDRLDLQSELPRAEAQPDEVRLPGRSGRGTGQRGAAALRCPPSVAG